MEASTPDIEITLEREKQVPLRRAGLLQGVQEIGALAGQRPDHLLDQLPGLVFLPLRDHHGVSHLQAVFTGRVGELRAPVEGGDIHVVEHLRHR